MHPARLFHVADRPALARVAAAHPFALIMANGPTAPVAAHAPVLLDDGGTRARFHLSAANALVDALAGARRARIVWTGPNAYVSPDWYGIDDQVPTWNYVSVEAEGAVAAVDEAAAAVLLDDLSRRFEMPLAPKPPWTRGKMSPGVFERMLRGIVAYEMTVERLEGVRKLSQNKPFAVRARVAAQLAAAADASDRAVAALMQDG